ncbi:hypothetical protein [Gordonia sp. DT101]|uniref:hypothetical protein n=1 Tax=Gordonia sp. DT101 TaxID=3416545 RepID=UPI003CF4B795
MTEPPDGAHGSDGDGDGDRGDNPSPEHVPDDSGADTGPPSADPGDGAQSRYRPTAQQWGVAAAIVAFGVGFCLYRLIKGVGLGQSAALYIGIPLVLAVVLTLGSPARRPAGMAMKVTTILLLLSVPVLGEGACCVLMAAPIFYLFVYLGARVSVSARDAKRRGPAVFVGPALLALLALEGTAPVLTVPGNATSSATRIIDLPAAQMPAALAAPLRLEATRPDGLLAIGFPRPVADSGGLGLGQRRTITFAGAHHRSGPVSAHHWGEQSSALHLVVDERTRTSVTFRRVADTSPLATWLRWDEMRVRWRAVDATHTEVRWELGYTRLLSPSWYFGSIERLVTWRAADYLIRTIELEDVSVTPPAAGATDTHAHR